MPRGKDGSVSSKLLVLLDLGYAGVCCSYGVLFEHGGIYLAPGLPYQLPLILSIPTNSVAVPALPYHIVHINLEIPHDHPLYHSKSQKKKQKPSSREKKKDRCHF